MRRAVLLLLLVWLAGCSFVAEGPKPVAVDPLLYDPEDIGRARELVVAIPGALTSIRAFVAIEGWRTPERTIAYYRLPGIDEMPEDQAFSVAIAASRIATFARDGGFEAVHLVGHSTGAVIALDTAKALRRVRPEMEVHVAGVSTALPTPQPMLAGLRTAKGTVGSIFRTGSLRPRTVWLDYYRRISYGPDPSLHAATMAAQLATVRSSVITIPTPDLARRHFRAILGWQNVRPEQLEGVDLAFWHGAVDPVFPPKPVQRFVDGLPEAELRVLETHGHVVHLTYLPLWDEIGAHWGFSPIAAAPKP